MEEVQLLWCSHENGEVATRKVVNLGNAIWRSRRLSRTTLVLCLIFSSKFCYAGKVLASYQICYTWLNLRAGGNSDSDSDSMCNATASRRIWNWSPIEASNEADPTESLYTKRKHPFTLERDEVQEVSINRRYRSSEHRDVVHCNSRHLSWTSDDDDDHQESDMATEPNGKKPGETDQTYVDYRGRLNGSQKLSHSPVVYQYYGRSRIRGNPNESVHFVLLGPNVDHWKIVGQILASRGFNTIACERLKLGSTKEEGTYDDSPNLVLDVLEALKWKKAILVGCDSEALLAMETAIAISPDQVAGLVLCGDLVSADKAAVAAGVGELESFLQRVLGCPFLIVSDGDAPTVISGSSAHRALEVDSSGRCLILGGGSAPHRLKPEQFAWVLTRFVEEKLEIVVKPEELTPRSRADSQDTPAPPNPWPAYGSLRALNLPFGINSLVSPEGRLILGRAVAAGLFYITAMRVIFIQYGILRAGLIAIKSKYESIDALTKKGFQAMASFIVNFGYIPRLFTLKRANDDEEDDNRRKGTIVLKEEQGDAKGENDIPESQEGSEQSTDDAEKGETQKEGHDDTEEQEENDIQLEEPERPPLFKPFFFLDNVVT